MNLDFFESATSHSNVKASNSIVDIFQDKKSNHIINFISTSKEMSYQEMHLKDLGKFPLLEDQESLLKLKLNDYNIPEIFKKSNIPIFVNLSSKSIYIPQASLAICNYFADLWSDSEVNIIEEEDNEFSKIVRGLLVLLSFAGVAT